MKKTLIAAIVIMVVIAGMGNFDVDASGLKKEKLSENFQELENIFSFGQLGYEEKLMIGPFDSASVTFSLPANIKLSPGSSVLLTYALAWSATGESSTDFGIAGTLLVYFNDELLDTIILDTPGEVSREILLTESSIDAVGPDGRNELRVFLDANVNCRYNNVHTTLILSKNSRFNFQYNVVSPSTDLSLLPGPLFYPDSILPATTLIIIPDNPEDYELQSALTVTTGLGSITGGEILLKMVTSGELTPDLVASNHLIFVGLANHFPELTAVDFPVPISGNGLNLAQDHTEDGVIQIDLSPWSLAHVALFVGGNSPDAVVKAAQTFTTGKIVAVEKPDVSLIQMTNPIDQEDLAIVDRTFKDIGYETRTLGIYGDTSANYYFYASAEQASSTGAYLDLVLSHSDLLDYESSGITMYLNDETVGGVRLTGESPTTTRIKLVPGVLRRGVNHLEIFTDILPFYTCYSADLLSTWISVNETSNIHLPISDQPLELGGNMNLRNYPYNFLSSSSMSDVLFILARSDSSSWSTAANVAFYIGTKGNLPIVNLNAAYADSVPQEVLVDSNLLLFGRSSTLDFLSQINDALPAPFQPGSDVAIQPSMLVNYSLLPETSVGYLQLLPSPWNPDKVILAVLGNTQDGVPMAAAQLTRDDLATQLAGNFAIMYEDQAVSTDTRLGLSKEGLISEVPIAVTVTPSNSAFPNQQEQNPDQAIVDRPGWILPVIGLTSVVIVLFIIFVVYNGYAKTRIKDEAGQKGKSPKDPTNK